MLTAIFTVFISFFSGLFVVLSFPIATFGSFEVTFLHLVLVCSIVPLLLSFIKENNSTVGHFTHGTFKSKTNKNMAYRNYVKSDSTARWL